MALSFSKILEECGSLRFVKNNQNTPTIMIVLVLIVWQNPAKNTQPFGPRARFGDRPSESGKTRKMQQPWNQTHKVSGNKTFGS